MRRKRDAEKTRKDIIDATIRLFIEKGYEQTSVTEILTACGKMSRGAFYHHFSSKQAVLWAIPDRLLESDEVSQNILNDSSRTGLDKARQLFIRGIERFIERPEDRMFIQLLSDPNTLYLLLSHEMEENIVPKYKHLISQGNADGSMKVGDPSSAAEMVALLSNLWCMSPLPATAETYYRRFKLFKSQLEALGIPLISEEMLPLCQECAKSLSELTQSRLESESH